MRRQKLIFPVKPTIGVASCAPIVAPHRRLNGVAGAGDLFNLYVFVEIASMAAYALIAVEGGGERYEASFKYALLGAIASTFILLGIGVFYGATGTLNMAHLAATLPAAYIFQEFRSWPCDL